MTIRLQKIFLKSSNVFYLFILENQRQTDDDNRRVVNMGH